MDGGHRQAGLRGEQEGTLDAGRVAARAGPVPTEGGGGGVGENQPEGDEAVAGGGAVPGRAGGRGGADVYRVGGAGQPEGQPGGERQASWRRRPAAEARLIPWLVP